MNDSTHSFRPSALRMSLYYLHRVFVNRVLRRLVVKALGLWIGKSKNAGRVNHPLLNSVREHGIVQLGQVLSEKQCAEVVKYLSDKPVRDANISIERAFCDAQPPEMAYGIHLLENVLDCPHLMEFVSSPSIIQLASDYLECKPTLSCLGVQWSFPTNSPALAQTFHRDSEDWKYLRFFVYLTDVNEGCGPHVYVKGSHRDKLPLRLKFYPSEDLSQRYSSDSIVKVFGKRGTGIAADTSGIHKGELPTQNPRLVLNFTFSILSIPIAEYKPLGSRHSPVLANYTNRLFLR